MRDACGEAAKWQCDFWGHVCEGCCRNPDTDLSECPCLECVHFDSFMPQSVLTGNGIDWPRRMTFCTGIVRYTPKKVIKWELKPTAWQYVDEMGRTKVSCGDYERTKRKNA